MGEDAALQIVIKFSFHIGGQAFGSGISIERGEKSLRVFHNHVVRWQQLAP
jgi:hypothetical protein